MKTITNKWSGNELLVKTVKNIPQLPPVQYDLAQQLKELRIVANKLGLYDAADFLRS